MQIIESSGRGIFIYLLTAIQIFPVIYSFAYLYHVHQIRWVHYSDRNLLHLVRDYISPKFTFKKNLYEYRSSASTFPSRYEINFIQASHNYTTSRKMYVIDYNVWTYFCRVLWYLMTRWICRNLKYFNELTCSRMICDRIDQSHPSWIPHSSRELLRK